MERRAFLRASGAAATVGLAGCLGGRADTPEYDVGMSAAAYKPPRIAVEPGTTVTWRNTSKQGHTVTAYEDTLPEGADFFATGGFDSEAAARDAWAASTDGTLFEAGSFSHTFAVRGEYPYFCIPHERNGMVGTVVVTDDPGTATDGA